jgi:hypothetical protein
MISQRSKKIWWFILDAFISIILFNFGFAALKESAIIGWAIIILAGIFFYSTFYIIQIKENEDRIKDLEKWIEDKEEFLNTLRDIVILKKVSKIK